MAAVGASIGVEGCKLSGIGLGVCQGSVCVCVCETKSNSLGLLQACILLRLLHDSMAVDGANRWS